MSETREMRWRFCEEFAKFTAAPRAGCGCLECYRARGDALPEGIRALLEPKPGEMIGGIGLSGAVIGQFVEMYCGGHATYEDAMVGLVRGLAETVDRLAKLEMGRQMRETPLILLKSD
jgi:hypothetical protein